MRTTAILAALALASPALAQQIPVPAFGNTFTSSLTRGFWFQAPTAMVIIGLEVPNEAMQPNQVVEVINLGAAPPAYPGTIVGTQLFYDNTTPSGQVIPCSIQIAQGDFIGVLGACNNAPSSPTSYNSYATPAGPYATTVFGQPITLTRFGTQSGIASNGGNQPCWQEAAGQLSRVNVYVVPPVGYALASTYGTGCPSSPLPLSHLASARPVIGTTFTLDTTNVPAAGLVGATLFGLTEFNPGLSLSSIGMPGCFQYVSVDSSQVWVPAGGIGSTTFAIPGNPAFAGVEIKSQGIALVPGANALGALSSNGVKLTLDIN